MCREQSPVLYRGEAAPESAARAALRFTAFVHDETEGVRVRGCQVQINKTKELNEWRKVGEEGHGFCPADLHVHGQT